jgi:hypothetical protein
LSAAEARSLRSRRRRGAWCSGVLGERVHFGSEVGAKEMQMNLTYSQLRGYEFYL